LSGHINTLECNADASGSSPNVFYNNVARHFDKSFTGGEVWWFCPNTTPEYWFNNLMYDIGNSQVWDTAGPPIYSCSNTGGQFMFNNTLVDVTQPCLLPANNTAGQYLTVYNEHLINTPYDGPGGKCIGGPSSKTNVAISDSTATKQGYTTGTSGTIGNGNNCANDTTTPCAPTSSSSSTVGAGMNLQSYCTTLASYTTDPSISIDAANACKYGTTDACTYDATLHTMNCPAQTAIARPASGAWDAGAYQFSASQSQAPQPPTNLQGTVSD